MLVRSSLWKMALLACVTCMTSLATADDKTYSLVYKFQSGQFFHAETEDRGEMIMQNASVQDKNGEPLESRSSQKTQMLKTFRVVTTDENGGAIIEPIVEKVRMSSQAGERPVVSFDSTTGEQPPREFEKIAGTLGRPLARFHLASNGRLLKVTMLVTDVPKSFTEAAEKADPMINFLVVLPEKPVKIGDKWSEQFEMPVSVGNNLTRKITMIKSYELTKVEENLATITVHANLFTPTDDPEILRQLAQMISRGTIEFDMDKGRLLSKIIRFDEKVVNAFGAQTLLHARGDSVERSLSKDAATRISNNSSGSPNPLPK